MRPVSRFSNSIAGSVSVASAALSPISFIFSTPSNLTKRRTPLASSSSSSFSTISSLSSVVTSAKRFASSSSNNNNNKKKEEKKKTSGSSNEDKKEENTVAESATSTEQSTEIAEKTEVKKHVDRPQEGPRGTGDVVKNDPHVIGVTATGKKQYWFTNVERPGSDMSTVDPVMEAVVESILHPEDPKAPAPRNVAPIPQIGLPPGGLVVEGPHEIAPPPFQSAPLMLAEEVPKPLQVLSEMELLMKAWSEEFARAYFIFTVTMRFLIACVSCFLLYFYYRAVVRIERIRRGSDNTPKNLRVGCVVYFDMEENGRPMGRVVIGLLTENAPLYCEYFHRRCTGNGGDGETFRGQRVKCMAPNAAVIFGDGKNMTHDVPGYNPRYLPTEYIAPGPWRGCLMSVPYAANQESPNFAILLNAGDFTPNVFGICMAGFDVLEKMASKGVNHACDPRNDYTIEGCGELCTLDKAAVQPMPWRLYETVSKGYDADKFGPKSDWKLLMKGLMGQDASGVDIVNQQEGGGWLGGMFGGGNSGAAAQQVAAPDAY